MFVEDPSFVKRGTQRGLYKQRRYKLLEWDTKRQSSGLLVSDNRICVRANNNCSPKTILGMKNICWGKDYIYVVGADSVALTKTHTTSPIISAKWFGPRTFAAITE